MIVCDHFEKSSIAYGEAKGLDAAWLTDMAVLLSARSLISSFSSTPRLRPRSSARRRDGIATEPRPAPL